jgi:hypothetical protein
MRLQDFEDTSDDSPSNKTCSVKLQPPGGEAFQVSHDNDDPVQAACAHDGMNGKAVTSLAAVGGKP